MKKCGLASAYQIGPAICKALGISTDLATRIIIDIDANDPLIKVYVQAVTDLGTMEVVCDILNKADLQELDTE